MPLLSLATEAQTDVKHIEWTWASSDIPDNRWCVAGESCWTFFPLHRTRVATWGQKTKTFNSFSPPEKGAGERLHGGNYVLQLFALHIKTLIDFPLRREFSSADFSIPTTRRSLSLEAPVSTTHVEIIAEKLLSTQDGRQATFTASTTVNILKEAGASRFR